MSDEQIINQDAVPEVVETPAPTPEPTPAPASEPEIVYEYQPMDEFGRKLGNKQVFKGKTTQEVLEKVANANKELIKLNRELKKNLRLGVYEAEELPEDALTYSNDLDISAPRQLTDEERFQISRDLLDPDKFDAASELLLEAKIGLKPEKITSVLNQQQQKIAAIEAKNEAEAFVSMTPDYFPCKENFETMSNWMVKNNLRPTRSNFKLAFEKLSAVGLLYDAPIVREETPVPEVPEVQVTPVNSQPEPEPVSRITDNEPQSQAKRNARVASGFTRDSTSDVGSTPKSTKLSVKDIERMASDEYKRRLLRDPNFAKEVDEAYAAASKRQA